MAAVSVTPPGEMPMRSPLVRSVLVLLLASPLVLILFGAEYSQSIPVMRLLAWMLVPFTVNTYLTLTLVAANREWPVLVALAAGLAALVALSFLWMPRFGLIGAGWAVFSSESLQAGMLLVQYRTKSPTDMASPALPIGTDSRPEGGTIVRND